MIADPAAGGWETASDWRPAAGDMVFIGGTGRTGTHLLARLLYRHPHFAEVPIELRLQCDKRGMPALLTGRVTLADFLSRLRDFWWHRVRVSTASHAASTNPQTRNEFDAALERFEVDYPSDPVPACRGLFVDLLASPAARQGKPGLVEMSSHNVREAHTLRQLFAEARFLHSVRDGRDAAASATTKTWGPDSILKGIDGRADRLRAIEVGVRSMDDGAAYLLSPADLLGGGLGRPRLGRSRGWVPAPARIPRGRRRRRHAEVLHRPDAPTRCGRGALATGAGSNRAPPRGAKVRGHAGGARARAKPRRPPPDRRARATGLTVTNAAAAAVSLSTLG